MDGEASESRNFQMLRERPAHPDTTTVIPASRLPANLVARRFCTGGTPAPPFLLIRRQRWQRQDTPEKAGLFRFAQEFFELAHALEQLGEFQ